MLISQFQTVGRELCARGLVSSHGGDLSIKLRERLYITHRGSMLNCLEEHDLVETGINKNDRFTPLASTELAVHRAIYKRTPASAIVHAHPAYAVVLSFSEQEIVPCDTEGSLLLSKVPVLGWKTTVKPGELAEEIAKALIKHKIVLVHGHGSFAAAQLLEEAYQYTSALEESCRLLYLLKTLRIKTDSTPNRTKK
ncbi:MAG: aldolase [Dehalococcoidia bacterium]|nr:aldolase [Dehalococcoidia bacterium]